MPDLHTILSTPATDTIDPKDVEMVLAAPPFVSISGSFNTRDLNDGTLATLKPDYIYRSGSLEHLTSTGAQALIALGIKAIFDLRSERERQESPEPDLSGIKCDWCPSTLDDPTVPKVITATICRDDNGEYLLSQMYMDMLQSHRDSFKAVFKHLLECPDDKVLFPCTAGKDRTGLLAALILSVANVKLEYIDHDYALTRVGIEPMKDFLLQRFRVKNPGVDMGSKEIQSVLRFP